MHLMLCCPPQTISYANVNAAPQISIPLGILSIAARLRESDLPGTIEIYDARLSANVHELADGSVIFGDSNEEVSTRIHTSNPDVIGISNMFTEQFPRALALAALAKRVCPNVIVVMGGPHVSSFPLKVLAEPNIDFIVMGEGEYRMEKLMACLEASERPEIEGVMGSASDSEFLRPHKKVPISFIDDVDDLPLPAYDLIDVDRYFHLQSSGYSPRPREWGKRCVTLLTSRGCPHSCVFCSIHATMGYKWRYHSAPYVEKHIRFLMDKYQIDFIHFEDDNFTHSTDRYDEILDVLLSLRPNIRWDTPNGVRADTWTRDRVRRTRESGCQYLTIAIESAVQRVIDKVIGKHLDLSQVDTVMADCQAQGLRLNAFYVIGFPGESLEEIHRTVRFALDRYRRFGVYPSMNIAMALPGTELHDQVVEQNLITTDLTYGTNQITTGEFDPPTLRRVFRYYTRMKIAIFFLRSLTSFRDFKYNVRLVFNDPRNTVRNLKRTVTGRL